MSVAERTRRRVREQFEQGPASRRNVHDATVALANRIDRVGERTIARRADLMGVQTSVCERVRLARNVETVAFLQNGTA